jgi:hypothetical protein
MTGLQKKKKECLANIQPSPRTAVIQKQKYITGNRVLPSVNYREGKKSCYK